MGGTGLTTPSTCLLRAPVPVNIALASVINTRHAKPPVSGVISVVMATPRNGGQPCALPIVAKPAAVTPLAASLYPSAPESVRKRTTPASALAGNAVVDSAVRNTSNKLADLRNIESAP